MDKKLGGFESKNGKAEGWRKPGSNKIDQPLDKYKTIDPTLRWELARANTPAMKGGRNRAKMRSIEFLESNDKFRTIDRAKGLKVSRANISAMKGGKDTSE
ncbi:hypothetical protein KM043_010545 [Ampulex compressa]|nr:hypothetical protein KM043_010545 [Ampulex compressa]